MKPRHVVALIAINVLWGLAYTVAKHALAETPSIVLAFARFALATLLMLPWLLHRGAPQHLRPPTKGHPALIGLCGFCLSYLLLYVGISLTTATETAILVNLEAIFTALLGRLLLAERLHARRGVGLALAFAGAMFLLRPEGNGHAAWPLARTLGNLCIVASVALEALATILSRHLRRTYGAMELLARAVGWGALLLLLPAAAQWMALGRPLAWANPVNAAEVAYLAGGCTVVAYLVWYRVLARAEAGVAAAFIYLQPLVGVAAGVTLLHEPLRASALAGAALIGCGVLLASRSAS
jgi:drug/metabolite transporter (DMT)-like permease